MALTQVATGTVPATTGTGTGSTSVSPDLPAGYQYGDILVMFVGTKPDTATINTPTDWTAPTNGTVSGGTGSQGADTGPVKLAVFYRIVDVQGSISAPTVSITNGNASWAWIICWRSTIYQMPDVWDVAAANDTDTSAGTSWSVTTATNPGFEAEDWLMMANCVPTDASHPANWSGFGFSATGATFANGAEVGEPYTSTGNDLGGVVFRARCSAGPATAAPTGTATSVASVSGASIVFRMRELDPSSEAPHVAVSATTNSPSSKITVRPAVIG
ncbi:hypothetical protein ACFY7C_19585 [Streptomyces sp. NPDC012769]|uniref:hypothetical protein n=1 Tax=Streptomyces sp. NPDC012769 TaxID=3364848 RepID=UPI003689D22F